MRLELILTCNLSKNLPPVNRLTPCEVTIRRNSNLMQRCGSLRTERRRSPR